MQQSKDQALRAITANLQQLRDLPAPSPDDVHKWARGHIDLVAKLCLPSLRIELVPQATKTTEVLSEQLVSSVTQFHQVLSAVHAQTETKINDLRSRLNFLALQHHSCLGENKFARWATGIDSMEREAIESQLVQLQSV